MPDGGGIPCGPYRLALHGGDACGSGGPASFSFPVEARAEGVPLQYLLGEWDFLSLRLSVREGVLIPRPETELLCETAAAYLRESGLAHSARPLCRNGCGRAWNLRAVPLGVGFLCGVVRHAVYLPCRKFRALPGVSGGTVRLDVLDPDAPARLQPVDVLVSNPPYIASGELPFLQEEVRREPRSAGRRAGRPAVYRAIAAYWLSLLLPGGLLAVEIGETQGEAVKGAFGACRTGTGGGAAGCRRLGPGCSARKPR